MKTIGTVTFIRQGWSANKFTYRIHLGYEANGETIVALSDVEYNKTALKVGDKVKIKVDKNNPGIVKVIKKCR